MRPSPHLVETVNLEREWRSAIIEANAARQEYESVVRAHDSDDPAYDRAWLRLWRAERRRNELARIMS